MECAKLAVGALLLVGARAYPSFVALNPNGANVVGVDSIGHLATAGSGPNNCYGLDFQSNGGAWTTALCLLDSDRDGQSNGLELGDPCCLWVGGTANFTTDVSHPGDPQWTTGRVCTDMVCPNGLNPCNTTPGSNPACTQLAPPAASPTPVPAPAPTDYATPVAAGVGAALAASTIGILALRRRRVPAEEPEDYAPLTVQAE